MTPGELANIVFKKIENNEFWILTHPEFVEVYETYANEITANKNTLD
jgi:hypothetical protein